MRYDSDENSQDTADETIREAHGALLLSALLHIDDKRWNDPTDIVREGCVFGITTRPALESPRSGRWHIEVIWDDGSISFAQGEEALPEVSLLYDAIREIQLQDENPEQPR